MSRNHFLQLSGIHFRFDLVADRDAVRKAYPWGNFPVFEGNNHMQYQIRDPEGFARMLESIMEKNALPEMPFLRKETNAL